MTELIVSVFSIRASLSLLSFNRKSSVSIRHACFSGTSAFLTFIMRSLGLEMRGFNPVSSFIRFKFLDVVDLTSSLTTLARKPTSLQALDNSELKYDFTGSMFYLSFAWSDKPNKLNFEIIFGLNLKKLFWVFVIDFYIFVVSYLVFYLVIYLVYISI